MLFVFQGAFTIGFQATVWVYPYVPPNSLQQRFRSNLPQLRTSATPPTPTRLLSLHSLELAYEFPNRPDHTTSH